MARTAGIIVCCAVAGTPAWALTARNHKPSAAAAAKAAHGEARKPSAKANAAKEAPAAIAKAYEAMAPDERLSIQSDLAWTGYYEGPPGGEFGDERVIDAIKLFQKAGRGTETGILNDDERGHLAAAAEPHRQAVGWRLIEDPLTGARFGLPEKLVSPGGRSWTGNRWVSGHRQIEIEDFSLSEANLPALFEQEKKTPRGRRVESSALQPDSFVISGTQGLKNFVVRAQSSGPAIRGITIAYDQAMAGIMAPVAIAMANSFQGFPDPNTASPPGQQRAVEYGTAIVVDKSGDLLTTRQAASDCATLMIAPFGHAVRIAEDTVNDLVLIRLYGAHNLAPAALGSESRSDDLTLIGIADPAAQRDGGAATKVMAHLDGQALEPAPKLGFSGAAAIDSQGGFAGTVSMKSSVDLRSGVVTEQAALVPATAVRAFLASHGINPAAHQEAMDQSVMRVICVRK